MYVRQSKIAVAFTFRAVRAIHGYSGDGVIPDFVVSLPRGARFMATPCEAKMHITKFGALVLVASVNVRQVVSILISYTTDGHSGTGLQFIGLALVVGGLFCQRYLGLAAPPAATGERQPRTGENRNTSVALIASLARRAPRSLKSFPKRHFGSAQCSGQRAVSWSNVRCCLITLQAMIGGLIS